MSQSQPSPQYGAFRNVRAKTNNVVSYHYDEGLPGKPLHLLIPGGLIALASLAIIVYVVYAVWFDGSMPDTTGWPLILLMAPFYVGGVFLFSYGYELYDLPKALRLTAIVVFITLAAVVIIAVLAVILGGGGSKGGSKSSSSSSKSSSDSSSDSSSGSSSSGWSSGHNIPSATRAPSSSGGVGDFMGPVFVNLATPTQTVKETVIEKEVAPQPPPPVTCPFCGRSYVPRETHFACPSCGAATPQDLLQPDDAPEANVANG